MDTDLHLLARYHRDGDAGAFQSLMLRYSGAVFATARRITQDAALAEEVAQDTFLALARRGRDIQDSVAAWLHHVARQKACNAIRGEVRRRLREQRAAMEPQAQGEESWQEIEPFIDAALDALPSGVRLLVIEHYLGRRTQQEIAADHGLSQSTVSRQIEKGLGLLREDLRRRGVLAGLGLGTLLTVNSIEAAPASLLSSLGKVGLSGLGTGTAGLTRLGQLLTMKTVGIAALPAALLIAAVMHNVASTGSLFGRWFSAPAPALASAVKAPPKATSRRSITNEQEERWAAEARHIWANAPKIQGEALLMAIDSLVEENDTPRRLALLHSVGVSLSRATLERLIKAHRDEHKRRTDLGLLRRVGETFFMEQPREAVALAYHLQPVHTPQMETSHLQALNLLMAHLMTANPCEPGAWAAFLKASPDPVVAVYAERWKQIAADPATLWSRAQECGIDGAGVASYILRRMEVSEPKRALDLLQRSPDAAFRARAVIGLAPRLSADQLLTLAEGAFATHDSLSNLLRAMAGEPTASFTDAAAFVLNAAQAQASDPATPDRVEPAYAEWAAQCMQQVYARWMKTEPIAAMQQALASGQEEYLKRFMTAAVNAGSLTEELIQDSLADLKPARRDAALAEFYRAEAEGDAAETLRRIVTSLLLEDQVEAAKPVLTDWAKADPEAAAQWLQDLPLGENRAELGARIAAQWVDRDPEAAVAFIQREGVRLRNCHGELCYSLRRRTEDHLRSLFKPLRGDPDFDQLVVSLAGYRLPSDPLVAFEFISRHAREGWQTLVVADTIRWLKNGDSRAEGYAQALPTMDLSAVPATQMTAAAELLAERSQTVGKPREAFDWAMRLRTAAAPHARSAVVAKLAAGGPGQRSLLAEWISQAGLGAGESASLLQILAGEDQKSIR